MLLVEEIERSQLCIYDNVLRKCVTHISNRNKMLLPPGIKNEGNICLASCVLHCPLNQEDICSLLNDVKVQH